LENVLLKFAWVALSQSEFSRVFPSVVLTEHAVAHVNPVVSWGVLSNDLTVLCVLGVRKLESLFGFLVRMCRRFTPIGLM
jgi:hypothetical protein